ncbi:MAG: hypothetical protein KKA07_05955 [Bacteroidetes bacterium]|nr:hypothetical protein [Bacteroidota bacterium]
MLSGLSNSTVSPVDSITMTSLVFSEILIPVSLLQLLLADLLKLFDGQ